MKCTQQSKEKRCDSCLLNKKLFSSLIILSSIMFFVVFTGSGLLNAGDMSKRTDNLWSKIQGEKYQKNWSLFPGKGKLYKGTEPHGMLLTTYVNKTAEKALNNRVEVMPTDSILIKENYKPDKALAAITVMEKTGQEKDDWFWVKYNPDGSVATMEMEKDGKKMRMPVAGGKKTMCASCHSASVAGIHNIMTPIE